jgi:hypothetical protein
MVVPCQVADVEHPEGARQCPLLRQPALLQMLGDYLARGLQPVTELEHSLGTSRIASAQPGAQLPSFTCQQLGCVLVGSQASPTRCPNTVRVSPLDETHLADQLW